MSQVIALQQLLTAIDIEARLSLDVSGVAVDTRELQSGDVFIALRGQREHGLRHAPAAVARGAIAIVAELPLPADVSAPDNVPLFVQSDLRQRTGKLADIAYGQPSAALNIVGVTGTNGKTSVVQFIAQAATRCGVKPATQGTLGAGLLGHLHPQERTTPDVCTTHRFLAEMLADGVDLVAMEVSSHALDQGRVDAVRFDVAVFTQLTRDHLDYHGSMDAYFDAKSRLFAWPELRAAVINLDDSYGQRLLRQLPSRVKAITYSALGDASASLAASDILLDANGLAFDLRIDAARYAIRTDLIGRFNVDNLLAATAALLALDIPADAAVEAISSLRPVPGRMNRLGGGDQPLVVIDYAHTPDAIAKALSTLSEHAPSALSIVFGCGGERDRGKRAQMAAAAEAVADRIYVTDDNPRGESGDAIVADIRAGFVRPAQAIYQRDRRAAIERAIGDAAATDIVLIAGKGHESYQEIDGLRVAFDDYAVAADVLAARRAA